MRPDSFEASIPVPASFAFQSASFDGMTPKLDAIATRMAT